MGKWSFLLNRYIVTFGSIVVVSGLWNLYIAFHDDGIVQGRVVGPGGQPVAGAEVVLSERTLLVSEARARTTTDAGGTFTFTGHRYHRIWLRAVKPNVGEVPQTEFRLYFRGQNLHLGEPLQMKAAAS